MNSTKKNNEKKKMIVIVVLAAAVVTLAIILGVTLSKSPINSGTDPPDTNSGFVIDPNAGDGKKPVADTPAKADSIKIPGYPSITIAANTPNVTMALLNPEENPCYFKFEIVLKDSGETIYESQYVPPGKTITDVTLTHGLSEGEHPATIKISTVALDQKTPLNGANVETVLIAK